MKFPMLICALATTSIYVSEALSYDDEESQSHDERITGCSGRHMELSNEMLAVKCAPRYTLVKLIPRPGFAFYPDLVTVKRCDGLCFNNKSCVPVETRNRKIIVRTNRLNSFKYFCYAAIVKEHLKCKCRCNVKESHCNFLQIYDENDCACKCKNMEDLLACEQMEGMRWNKETCECTCDKPQEECSSGLVWVPSLCGCAKVMSMSDDDMKKR